MGKKKKTAKVERKRYMVALSEEFHQQLLKLKDRDHVPISEAVRWALKEFLEKKALWPPEPGD